MDSIGLRLREERNRLNLSQTELGEAAGITKNTQRLYESDQRSPKADYLSTLANLGVDVQFVLTGLRSHPDKSDALALNGSVNDALPVPMYDIEAAAGAGRLFDAETIQSTFYLPVELFEAEGVDPAQVVGVTARGDSMGDTIRDREQVLVNRAQRTPDGVFLLRMGDELRLKRVQRVAGGAWILISDNPAYERELIKPEDLGGVEIIGQAWRKVGRVF
ncbi:LexA family transcriptional regulator [Salinicola sp. CR57]|uniref:XRE family transcriptional regulator n=1 Tax=Salinicola sp. CR57 TaxID=1949086 RepID=UPI0013009133|nr:LexA family transcriptional regulator [Salinicola sp. CR57]